MKQIELTSPQQIGMGIGILVYCKNSVPFVHFDEPISVFVEFLTSPLMLGMRIVHWVSEAN